MKKEFDLVLVSSEAFFFTLWGGCMATVVIMGTTGHAHPAIPSWLLDVAALSALYGVYLLAKRIGCDAVRVIVEPTGLVILDRGSGREKRLLFNNIRSYRHLGSGSNQNLRFKLNDKSEEFLNINKIYDGNDNAAAFDAMMQAFEAAAQPQSVVPENSPNREPSPNTPPLQLASEVALPAPTKPHRIEQEKLGKPFFEKPIATVVLVVMIGIVVVVAGMSIFSTGLNGNLIGSAGAALSYIGSYTAARQKRAT